MQTLDGKVAVVTTGARGIGRAGCEGLATAGAGAKLALADKVVSLCSHAARCITARTLNVFGGNWKS